MSGETCGRHLAVSPADGIRQQISLYLRRHDTDDNCHSPRDCPLIVVVGGGGGAEGARCGGDSTARRRYRRYRSRLDLPLSDSASRPARARVCASATRVWVRPRTLIGRPRCSTRTCRFHSFPRSRWIGLRVTSASDWVSLE